MLIAATNGSRYDERKHEVYRSPCSDSESFIDYQAQQSSCSAWVVGRIAHNQPLSIDKVIATSVNRPTSVDPVVDNEIYEGGCHQS